MSKSRWRGRVNDAEDGRPVPDAVRHHPFAAPGGKDDVGCRGDHGFGWDDAVLGGLVGPQVMKDILAAGDLNQL